MNITETSAKEKTEHRRGKAKEVSFQNGKLLYLYITNTQQPNLLLVNKSLC